MAVTSTYSRAKKIFSDIKKDGKGSTELRVIVKRRVSDYLDQGE